MFQPDSEMQRRPNAASHDDILRRCLAPPAAFGAAKGEVAAQVVATSNAPAALGPQTLANQRYCNGGNEQTGAERQRRTGH